MKPFVRGFLARAKHLLRAFCGGAELTPQQKARLDEMEQEYKKLVQVETPEPAADFPKNP